MGGEALLPSRDGRGSFLKEKLSRPRHTELVGVLSNIQNREGCSRQRELHVLKIREKRHAGNRKLFHFTEVCGVVFCGR